MRTNLFRLAGVSAALLLLFPGTGRSEVRRTGSKVTQGMLTSIGVKGDRPCPLKHTSVNAEISGPLARVTVVQEFENPYPERIEAVYTFPLPHSAAVDRMAMRIGGRVVTGKIKRREEARAIYDAARNAGHLTSLLDQERPNIFTQAVANIAPGEQVRIEISYVETVRYEGGNYEFTFPMVVGPRYIPRGLPGAERISPPVTAEGTRAGHDVSIEVALDAGVPIQFLRSLTHDIEVQRADPKRAAVRLKNKAAIPNQDFVLQYDVSGNSIGDALLAHRGEKGGFFTFLLQPPDHPRAEDLTPKEIVFVLDTSGSMTGFPMEKAKEAMRLALEGMNRRDTFNLITFSGDTHILFPQPVPATQENLRRAEEFLASRRGSGGTEMMKAIRAALDPSDQQDHLRVVCFMTDGYVGNDMEIIGEVKRHANARVFAFGIGGSVNRFLLDGMARAGRGEVEYVGLEDDGSAAAKRFHERVRSPLLTDVSIDWGGLPVSEVYPSQTPDLFSAKPVVVSGRYAGAARGVIRLRGKMAGKPYTREIPVALPSAEPRHDVAATLWARNKIDDLMGRDWSGIQLGKPERGVQEEVTRLGLDFRLMTQFTSFVAVEERTVTEGGQPRRVEVPAEMPAGVSYEGIYGKDGAGMAAMQVAVPGAMGGFRGGVAGGAIGGYPRPASPLRSMPAPERWNEAGTGWPARPTRKVDPGLLTRSGTVEVRVFLSDAAPEILKKLAEAGLEGVMVVQPGRLVTGRIAASKLEALARVAAVKYIAPRA